MASTGAPASRAPRPAVDRRALPTRASRRDAAPRWCRSCRVESCRRLSGLCCGWCPGARRKILIRDSPPTAGRPRLDESRRCRRRRSISSSPASSRAERASPCSSCRTRMETRRRRTAPGRRCTGTRRGACAPRASLRGSPDSWPGVARGISCRAVRCRRSPIRSTTRRSLRGSGR